MRIISKHKDYYDYMVGTYGLDPTITYDRRTDSLRIWERNVPSTFNANSLDPVERHIFHVCNRKLSLFEYKGKMYHQPNELLELNKRLVKDGLRRYTLSSHNYYYKKFIEKEEEGQSIYDYYNTESKVNMELRQPVLIEDTHPGEYSVPFLQTYSFHKVYTPDVIYQKIYQFLSWLIDNPPLPNKQTDTEKLLSHGFDKKTSFRNM